ncbi:MAG: RNA-binding S4 domain-containing protein [Clostridia bacterium]|nr:RNA-binding S4 domain-containing protein [Clostridia bacterium]
MKEIYIKTDFIKLDSFLKLCGEAPTGGDAKKLILDGFVKISDEVCCQRGKKIISGTEICVNGNKYKVIKE